ncbi:MAG: glycosyltransferase family 4 protein [Planctomycetes bacterium]|nr:glycosyltransferase family 4 protein [Planctomycetota bacterium]
MRLLFLTQTLDRQDAVLGFVPRWVEEFASRVEAVRVVALSAGDLQGLPPNVDVRVVGRKGIVMRALRYRSYLRKALGKEGFDTVLAHMIPRYALFAASPARRAGAPLFLWYTHGAVDGRLLRAERVVDRIFTASEESLRLSTPKKLVTGHGIDLEHFDSRGVRPLGTPRLLSVGRLSAAKDPLTVIEAVGKLIAQGRDVALDIVGAGLASGDAAYEARVRERIAQGGLAQRVLLHPGVSYLRIPEHYRRASVCVNASSTGSVDKVILEAMASARPVVSCNDAFPRVVASLGEAGRALCFAPGDADGLATQLGRLLDQAQERRFELGLALREIVARDHELGALIQRLVSHMGAGR